MKEAGRGGHAHECGDFGAAAGLAVDHHIVGIAAEIGDIVADPFEGGDEVGHADVDGIGISGAGDFGEVEEAEDIEAVVDGDLDDIMLAGHLGAFMGGEFIGGAEGEAAAVEIDHDGAFAGEAGGPEVDLEHVFGHVAVVPVLDEGLFDGGEVVEFLGAVGAVDEGGVFAIPGFWGLGGEPAVVAAGVLAVGDSFEGEYAAIEVAADFAVLGGGDGGTRGGEIAGDLMGGGFDAVGGGGGAGEGSAQAGGGRGEEGLAASEGAAAGSGHGVSLG